jgi:polyisoprenoid-binding protein YceI
MQGVTVSSGVGELVMHKKAKYILGFAISSLLVGGLVRAQASLPQSGSMPPPGAMAPASKNPSAAPVGAYQLDLEHASVVARVPHRGMSFNVLRFGVKEGALRWNPAKPSDIAVEVTVDAKPYYAPIVYTIPPEGPQSLNSAKFPEAKFVSTAVRVKGGGKAVIEGKLTLMGVTKAAVINAELVGVGRSMKGVPTIGFTGTMVVNWADFTDLPIAKMIGNATVILDAEFTKGL